MGLGRVISFCPFVCNGAFVILCHRACRSKPILLCKVKVRADVGQESRRFWGEGKATESSGGLMMDTVRVAVAESPGLSTTTAFIT